MICGDCGWLVYFTPDGEILRRSSCPTLDPEHPGGNIPIKVTKCPDFFAIDKLVLRFQTCCNWGKWAKTVDLDPDDPPRS